MASFNKKILVELALWYILCLVAPFVDFTFNVKVFVHDLSVPGSIMWLLRDFCYTYGLFMMFRIATLLAPTKTLRVVFMVGAVDWAYEIIDLIVFNNEYNITSLILSNILVIITIIYAFTHDRVA